MEAIVRHSSTMNAYTSLVSDGAIDYLGQIGEEALIICAEDYKKGKDN